MTKASFHLPEQPAEKKRRNGEAFRWTDATVFAQFRDHAVAGQCGYDKCRIDDPIVYAFPADPKFSPPAYHWQCFQKVMDVSDTRRFGHLTADIFEGPKKRAKVTA